MIEADKLYFNDGWMYAISKSGRIFVKKQFPINIKDEEWMWIEDSLDAE